MALLKVSFPPVEVAGTRQNYELSCGSKELFLARTESVELFHWYIIHRMSTGLKLANGLISNNRIKWREDWSVYILFMDSTTDFQTVLGVFKVAEHTDNRLHEELKQVVNRRFRDIVWVVGPGERPPSRGQRVVVEENRIAAGCRGSNPS
jgi:hypothetical protein